MPDILSISGDLERLLSEHLYPYRYVLTPLMALAVAGAVTLALRFGVQRFIWRHRLASAAVGLPLLALSLVAGNYFLSPLWERSHLEEASPLQVASQAGVDEPKGVDVAMMSTAPVVAQPAIRVQGVFKGADDFHFGRGDALIIYLSHDAGGNRVDEKLNLGRLKATDGAFNYEIPAGIDLASVKSVVVWCRQFAVQFAVASLM
jgi:hypothetical protein